MTTFCKLRDMSTGLFSSGGLYPTWTKKGKIWTLLGSLKRHLTLFTAHHGEQHTILWEVVELNADEGEKYPAATLANRKKK